MEYPKILSIIYNILTLYQFMKNKAKFVLINLVINLLILSISFLGIQNANKKGVIKFLSFKSVELPIGFILASSFILGSCTSGCLFVVFQGRQKKIK